VLSGQGLVGENVQATGGLLESTGPNQAHQSGPRDLSGGELARAHEAALFDYAQDLHGLSVGGHLEMLILGVANDNKETEPDAAFRNYGLTPL
jgi:hypothetical protein